MSFLNNLLILSFFEGCATANQHPSTRKAVRFLQPTTAAHRLRLEAHILPFAEQVDKVAAEFPAYTNHHYTTICTNG